MPPLGRKLSSFSSSSLFSCSLYIPFSLIFILLLIHFLLLLFMHLFMLLVLLKHHHLPPLPIHLLLDTLSPGPLLFPLYFLLLLTFLFSLLLPVSFVLLPPTSYFHFFFLLLFTFSSFSPLFDPHPFPSPPFLPSHVPPPFRLPL